MAPLRPTLSWLGVVDSFGGALVSHSLIAYWFTLRFGASPESLGAIFFADDLAFYRLFRGLPPPEERAVLSSVPVARPADASGEAL